MLLMCRKKVLLQSSMTYSYHTIALPPENNWLIRYIGAITKTMTGAVVVVIVW